MNSAPPAVSVVVVTYDSAKWIVACLDALQAQRFSHGFETIIVDNQSKDDTLKLVRAHPLAPRIIEQPNRGFGAGNNAGARVARGAVLAFLNPDTVADADWLASLVSALVVGRRMSTSRILLADATNRINTCGNQVHTGGYAFTIDHRRDAGSRHHDRPVPGVSGAAFAIAAADFARVGGFDERFFLYGEDTELSWRARRHGIESWLAAGSQVRHHYALRMDRRKFFHLHRGRTLLLRTHLRLRDRFLLFPTLLLTNVVSWLVALRWGPPGLWARASASWQAWTEAPAVVAPARIPARVMMSARLPVRELTKSRLVQAMLVPLWLLFWLNAPRWRLPDPDMDP